MWSWNWFLGYYECAQRERTQSATLEYVHTTLHLSYVTFCNINLPVLASLYNNSIVSGWFYSLVQLQELQKPDMLNCFWKKPWKREGASLDWAEDIIYLSHVGCPSTYFHRSSSPFAPLKSSRFGAWPAVILVYILSCVRLTWSEH